MAQEGKKGPQQWSLMDFWDTNWIWYKPFFKKGDIIYIVKGLGLHCDSIFDAKQCGEIGLLSGDTA